MIFISFSPKAENFWPLAPPIFLSLSVSFAFGTMFCIWLNFIEFGWISLYLAKFLCILVYFIIVWPANYHGRRLALCSEQRWWWRQPKPVGFDLLYILCYIYSINCVLVSQNNVLSLTKCSVIYSLMVQTQATFGKS